MPSPSPRTFAGNSTRFSRFSQRNTLTCLGLPDKHHHPLWQRHRGRDDSMHQMAINNNSYSILTRFLPQNLGSLFLLALSVSLPLRRRRNSRLKLLGGTWPDGDKRLWIHDQNEDLSDILPLLSNIYHKIIFCWFCCFMMSNISFVAAK